MASENKRAAKELLKDNGGLFDKFEWMPDEYGTEKKLQASGIKDREQKVLDVHGTKFNPA